MLLRSNQFESRINWWRKQKEKSKMKRKYIRELGNWDKDSCVIRLVICERCKHQCNTESFLAINFWSLALGKILPSFYRSNKTSSKLAEVQSTVSLQVAVCVCSWPFENCHFQASDVLFIVQRFSRDRGKKAVAITTFSWACRNS